MFGHRLVATDDFDDLQWLGPEDWVSNVWTRWQGCEWMGRTQERWELVMGPVPCPVRGRRIPGQGGEAKREWTAFFSPESL